MIPLYCIKELGICTGWGNPCGSRVWVHWGTGPGWLSSALAPPKAGDLRNELDRYLIADVEDAPDVLAWWHERRGSFPHLSRMALDYLTIPGMFYSSSRYYMTLTRS
jgi:hypothetical protein